jgi:hypothetical protein
MSSGTTGTIAPTHSNGTSSDGSVNWLFIEPYYRLSNFSNSIYLALGKVTDWDNEPSPDIPLDNDINDFYNLNDIVAMKKVTQLDARLGIKKNLWTSGVIYSPYDPEKIPSEYLTPFYVINSENNIYKCIWNGTGSLSTSEPTGMLVTSYIYTSDNYVWKYLGTINNVDAVKFTTTTYVPVEYKFSDDESVQWDVQFNSKKGSISYIKVLNGGTGYSGTATVQITGDGTNATATATIGLSGNIESIVLTNIGQNYTSTPTITITGNGTGATASAILAPLNGHGWNLPIELNAKDVIMNVILEGSVGGYFPITDPSNDYRQIVLLVDPVDNTTNDIATETAYIGPSHPLYNQSSGLNKIKPHTGVVLNIDNREKLIKDASLKEEIRIIFNF